MKLKKEWLFLKSFRLAKSNPSKIGLMLLFDLLFFVSFFYVFPDFGKYLAQNLSISQTISFAIIVLLFQIVYVLLILFVYSFFKYCVLDSIKSIFHKAEFSLSRLWQFYLLNIILFLPPYFAFSFILSGIKEAYQPYVFISLGLVVSPFLYILVNIAQSYFYQGHPLKKSISKGFSNSIPVGFFNLLISMPIIILYYYFYFRFLNSYIFILLQIIVISIFIYCFFNYTEKIVKHQKYKEIMLFVILFGLLIGLGYSIIAYTLEFIVSNSYTSYLITYAYFKSIFIIIFDILFYCIILVNRISFYSLAKES